MSLQGDAARESMARCIIERIAKKIKKNKRSPGAVKALKELGSEILDFELDVVPDWAQKYHDLFKK